MIQLASVTQALIRPEAQPGSPQWRGSLSVRKRGFLLSPSFTQPFASRQGAAPSPVQGEGSMSSKALGITPDILNVASNFSPLLETTVATEIIIKNFFW